MNGWRTSIGAGGKAHLYQDGVPACGERKGIWPGVKRADLFTRPTRQAEAGDHLCAHCRKDSGTAVFCTCWHCMKKREREREQRG